MNTKDAQHSLLQIILHILFSNVAGFQSRPQILQKQKSVCVTLLLVPGYAFNR